MPQKTPTVKDRAALDAAKSHLRDYLIARGFEPDKNMHCIFHSPDAHPSMSLLPDGRAVHCFACGHTADIVNVIAQLEGFAPNSKEAIERAIEFAGSATSPSTSTRQHSTRDKKVDFDAIERHIQFALAHFDETPCRDYLKKRGFTDDDLDTLRQFDIGFDPIHKTLVIPHGYKYYTARRIDSDDKQKRFIFNCQAPVQIFNEPDLFADRFAVTEGPIDALSLICAGFPAVALGGSSTQSMLIKKLQSMQTKPGVYIAFDNDQPGRNNADKLKARLDQLGVPSQIIFPPDYHDFNDFFKEDRSGLEAFIDHLPTMVQTFVPSQESVTFFDDNQQPTELPTLIGGWQPSCIDDADLIKRALAKKKKKSNKQLNPNDPDSSSPFYFARFGADDLKLLFVDGKYDFFKNRLCAVRRLIHILTTFADNNPQQVFSLFRKSALDRQLHIDDSEIIPIINDIVRQHLDNHEPIFNQIAHKMRKQTRDPSIPVNCTENFDLVFLFDPVIKHAFAFNGFAQRIEPTRTLPWRNQFNDNQPVSDADDSHIRNLIDRNYKLRGSQTCYDCLVEYSHKLWFHPVHDFFHNLPTWDQTPRAESIFIERLGVKDSPYARAVTKAWLLAAVARVFHPGCKFDYCLVLQGKQGIGKSTILRQLGGNWFGELDSISDEDVVERLQGLWIIELTEMQATKKAENEQIKAFISRQVDRTRFKYGRRTNELPRQCIFAATTNDHEFLRDQTGSRRFLILECNAEQFSDATDDYTIRQIWAEVFHLYNVLFADGFDAAKLDIDFETKTAAALLQEAHTEGSDLQGRIEAFLDTPIPDLIFWRLLTKVERRIFIDKGRVSIPFSRLGAAQDKFAHIKTKSDIGGDLLVLDPHSEHADELNFDYRYEVSSAEIASELLGIDNFQRDRSSLRIIRAILDKLSNWQYQGRATSVDPIYGQQRHCYERVASLPKPDTPPIYISDNDVPF